MAWVDVSGSNNTLEYENAATAANTYADAPGVYSGGIRTFTTPGTGQVNEIYARTRLKGEINLQTYSEDFGSWTNRNASDLIDNSGISPSGSLDAALFADNGDAATNNRLIWENGILPTGSTIYTQSCYIKESKNNIFQLSFRGDSSNVTTAVFNVETGAVIHTYNSGDNTLGQTSIHNEGNGWFRCRVTTTLGTLGDGRITFGPLDAVGSLTDYGYGRYVGNGNTGCLIWGYMVSEGPNLRRYTKTEGVISTTIERGELSKDFYDATHVGF